MKPVLIFDGDCNFCRKWIYRWTLQTGDAVRYEPWQQAAVHYPGIPAADFQKSVVLIEADGKVFRAAEAVFRVLAYRPGYRWLLSAYRWIPGFSFFSEAWYRFVASHRILFSRLTRFFWGHHLEPPTYEISRLVFLRALSLIYLCAIVSFWVQAGGLIGREGIIPLEQTMAAAREYFGSRAPLLLPMFFWLGPPGVLIPLVCAAGVLAAAAVLLGFYPRPFLFLVWLCYLSLTTGAQNFLGFQWDSLLLEAGFLAIFFAPWSWRDGARFPSGVHWLFRWLVFRFMFSSGIVKLLSGDPSWWNGTALLYHYETQPLPHFASWYASSLPAWFHFWSLHFMFFCELVLPFLVFFPRRLRHFAAAGMILLQLGILGTGNFAFFNYLTLALCLLLFDDSFWPAGRRAETRVVLPPIVKGRRGRRLLIPLAGVLVFLSVLELGNSMRLSVPLPPAVATLRAYLMPCRIVNGYGLFAWMTKARPEIIVEGSTDGKTWKAYELPFKPGDPGRRPGLAAPHQPRLDWQLWFAALQPVERNPWVLQLGVRLLEGSKPVLSLFQKNPFPDAPPKYLRMELYDYRFTTPSEKAASGNWWKRTRLGPYTPVLTLKKEER